MSYAAQFTLGVTNREVEYHLFVVENGHLRGAIFASMIIAGNVRKAGAIIFYISTGPRYVVIYLYIPYIPESSS